MDECGKIALVDLDGTIIEHDQDDGEEFDIDHFGPVKPKAREGINLLKSLGYTIVVWTVRGNDSQVEGFLQAEKIPYDYVNEHPQQPESGSGKPYADLIIDDRALGCPDKWSKIIGKIKGEARG